MVLQQQEQFSPLNLGIASPYEVSPLTKYTYGAPKLVSLDR
jgi:hypothetical protein